MEIEIGKTYTNAAGKIFRTIVRRTRYEAFIYTTNRPGWEGKECSCWYKTMENWAKHEVVVLLFLHP